MTFRLHVDNAIDAIKTFLQRRDASEMTNKLKATLVFYRLTETRLSEVERTKLAKTRCEYADLYEGEPCERSSHVLAFAALPPDLRAALDNEFENYELCLCLEHADQLFNERGTAGFEVEYEPLPLGETTVPIRKASRSEMTNRDALAMTGSRALFRSRLGKQKQSE